MESASVLVLISDGVNVLAQVEYSMVTSGAERHPIVFAEDLVINKQRIAGISVLYDSRLFESIIAVESPAGLDE